MQCRAAGASINNSLSESATVCKKMGLHADGDMDAWFELEQSKEEAVSCVQRSVKVYALLDV